MVKIIEVASVTGGGSGGAPTGAAGGSLAGTYPNPTLAASSVGSTQLVNGSVVNADLANMVPNTIKGRITTGAGAPEDLTSAQLATVLGSGSGGGTTNFLRADGTWAAPAGGGGGSPTGAAGGSLAGTYPNPTLSPTAVADLNVFTTSLKGLAPSSGGGTSNFLRADGTWAAPPGGGGTVFSDSAFGVQDNTDPSKQLAFEVSSIPTATVRTLALPTMTADDTIVAQNAVQLMTNKTSVGSILQTSSTLTRGITIRGELDTQFNDWSRATQVEIFGNITYNAKIGFMHQGGSASVPAQTTGAATLGSITARGYTGTGYTAAASGSIEFISEETSGVTTSAKGTRFRVAVTPLGTNTLTDAFRVNTDAVPSGVFRGSLVSGAGSAMASPVAGYGFECRSGAIGYGVGTGNSVTQTVSQTTAVTINSLCGQITMFSAAGSTAWSLFIVNNSLVSANDMVVVSIYSSVQNYHVITNKIEAGKFQVSFQSLGGVATAAPVVSFMVFKGVIT